MKTKIEELAFFGGAKLFSEPRHVGRPNIGDRKRLLERIEEILDNRWLTNDGPFVQEFEKEIAKRAGVKHCIAICNGTVALEIASRALGLTGEVIVPAFTFVATVHALQWQGLEPVFCDVDPATHTIDPIMAEKLISPRTSGIVGVHLWGKPCQVEALASLAKKRGLKLMFDAAHAFGCGARGRMIGGFGDAEVYSFHATKTLNSFEGGAIVTNDEALAQKIRLMKNFGFGPGYDNVIYLGVNGKMNEASAAMGLTGLESLDKFISVNKKNYELYAKNLAKVTGVKMVRYEGVDRSTYPYIILEWDEAETGLSRDGLVRLLHAENILARRYFYPGVHRMEPYRSDARYTGLKLPETERLASRVICLPTGTGVDAEDILMICQIIAFVSKHGRMIQEKITTHVSR